MEQLPEDATWDDLMHEIYVRQAIEAGLRDSQAGRTLDVKEGRARFSQLRRKFAVSFASAHKRELQHGTHRNNIR